MSYEGNILKTFPLTYRYNIQIPVPPGPTVRVCNTCKVLTKYQIFDSRRSRFLYNIATKSFWQYESVLSLFTL